LRRIHPADAAHRSYARASWIIAFMTVVDAINERAARLAFIARA
jgi:hypothetical protein